MVGNFPSFHLLQVLVTKLVEWNYVLVEWSRLLCLDIFSRVELKFLEWNAPKQTLRLVVFYETGGRCPTDYIKILKKLQPDEKS